MSLVEEHCRMFADGDKLTGASIKCPHLRMLKADGSSLYRAWSLTLAGKAAAILALGDTVETVAGQYNPAASHIWDAEGRFDSSVFEQLFAAHGTTVDAPIHTADDTEGSNSRTASAAPRAITRRGFNAFLRDRRVPAASGTACTIFKFVGVTWERITSGSLDELFQLFADCTCEGEPAIREATLRFFYTQPGKALATRRRETKNTP